MTGSAQRTLLFLLVCSDVALAVQRHDAFGITGPATSFSSANSPAVSPFADMPLFIEVTLNHRSMGLQPARWRDERVYMLRDVLIGMGVRRDFLNKLSGDALHREGEGQGEWISLAQLPDVQWQFNQSEQRLTLGMPFTALDWTRTQLGLHDAPTQAATASRSALLNYDFYGYSHSSHRRLSAATEWRVVSANAVFSSTMLSQYGETRRPYVLSRDVLGRVSEIRPSRSSKAFQNTRLDTRYSLSFPEALLTLNVGDIITGQQAWSRATRLGGLQLTSNFGLQPYRPTTPIPALMGTAALPSDVELFINGVRQYQGKVPAGPFSLSSLSSMSGDGHAQVVLTDAMGRATTLEYSLFDSHQLLAPGLQHWSAELGWVRREYGRSSWRYGGDPVVSGSFSRGLSSSFTLRSHAEMTKGLVNAGIGGNWQLRQWGVASGAAAVSQQHGASGQLIQAGHHWRYGRLHTSVLGSRTSAHYRDAVALHESASPQTSARATMGASTRELGNFSVGFVSFKRRENDAQRLLNLSWSRSLGASTHLMLSVNRDLNRSRHNTAQLMFSWYLDNRVSLSSSVTRQGDETRASVQASRSATGDNGWGWGVAAHTNERQGSRGDAMLSYYTPMFDARSTLSQSREATSGSLELSGSLVALDGHVFASRRVHDGFAVISTSGFADVPVRRDNALVGRTNADGLLLVTQLGAYRNNRITIDPFDLPVQTRVDQVEQIVTPTDRAGVKVEFGIRALRSATVVLHDVNGKPVPLGSVATLLTAGPPEQASEEASDESRIGEAQQSAMVGHDGIAYFESLASHNRIRVHWGEGGQCEAWVDGPKKRSNDHVPFLGALTCK